MLKSRPEVSPNDKYWVHNCHKLTEIDQRMIHLLYQPLVGSSAISLYQLLLSEVFADQMWSKSKFHSWLLDIMGCQIEELIADRKKLEAIGLLRVWKKDTDANDEFFYEIQSPYSAEVFFKDDILPYFLRQKVGDEHFKRLQEMFTGKKIPKDYKEITVSFDSVFASLKPDTEGLAIVDEKKKNLSAGKRYFTKSEPENPKKVDHEFDFNWLFDELKGNFFDRKLFGEEEKHVVTVLAYLYTFNEVEMAGLIHLSTDPKGKLDLEILRKKAREKYTFNNLSGLPVLVERVQPNGLRTMSDPQTEEEKRIALYEGISPLGFLREKSDQSEPAQADLKILENIMMKQNLNPAVVNVLIDYVLTNFDNRLQPALIEKIAAELARKKVRTAVEALTHFETRQKEMEEIKDKPKATRRNYNGRTEIVPEWMKDSTVGKTNEVKQGVQNSKGIEIELERLLKGGK
ncbi:MAG: Replication initiation and rane attachment protein [Bacillales bacterium]|nr:Replication initiation and rane attachment protein [Bacillales bacterium]